MSKKTKAATAVHDKSNPYVTMVKFPQRRVFLILVCILLTALFSIWIWANLHQNRNAPWAVIALPMIFIGMLANFVMPTEEWQYTPWQEATQKYEKNIDE